MRTVNQNALSKRYSCFLVPLSSREHGSRKFTRESTQDLDDEQTLYLVCVPSAGCHLLPEMNDCSLSFSYSNHALLCSPPAYTQKMLSSLYSVSQQVWFCKAFWARGTSRLLSSTVLPLMFPPSRFRISEEATQYCIWQSASPDLQKEKKPQVVLSPGKGLEEEGRKVFALSSQLDRFHLGHREFVMC